MIDVTVALDCDECGARDVPRFKKVGAIRICLPCWGKLQRGEAIVYTEPPSVVMGRPEQCRIEDCTEEANPRYSYVCTRHYTRLRKNKEWDSAASSAELSRRLREIPTKKKGLGPVVCIWPGCTAPTWLCSTHRDRFRYGNLNPKTMDIDERQRWMEAWVPMPGKKRAA